MTRAFKALAAGLIALAAALLGVATLGALVLGAGLVTIDGDALKPWVARQLSATLERQVVIAGDLRLEPGLQPLVVIHELKLADARWANRPYMAEIPRLAVRFDIPRLLRGEIELHRVALEAPAVTLETAADGRHNWSFALDEEDEDDAVIPIMRSLRMNGGVLTYIDRARGVRTQTEFRGARGSVTGPQRALELHAAGRVDEAMPLQLDASAEALTPVGDRPLPIRAELRLGEARVVAEGTVGGGDGSPGRVALDLLADVPTIASLQPVVPWTLPEWPALRLEARAVREGTRVTLDDLEATLGESDVSGRIELDTGGPRPQLSAVLQSRTLDLVQLAGRPSEEPGPVIPEDDLAFDRLQAFDAELRYQARTLYLPQLSLEHARLGLALEDGVLRIDPLQFAVGEGRVRSETLRIDTRQRPTSVTAAFAIEQLGLNAMLQEFDLEANAFGKLDGGFELAGRGASLAAILGSAQGDIELIMQEGEFDALLTSLAGQNAPPILEALGLEEDATTPLRCFIADFGAEDGLLTARTLVFDTPDTLVVGAGDIDLDAQRVNLAFLPQQKEATLLAAQAPVHIAGGFTDIEFALDTGAAIASLITPVELPDADDVECRRLAEAARRN
ncbi:MAG: AsmA family protein [Halofilum sp. (in: g-proteobacteria)]